MFRLRGNIHPQLWISEAHNSMQQGCFSFFHYFLATLMINWAHRFVTLCIRGLLGYTSEDTGLCQLRKMFPCLWISITNKKEEVLLRLQLSRISPQFSKDQPAIGAYRPNMLEMIKNPCINRPVCFIFERAGAPMHFLLGKGHPMKKLPTRRFKGTKEMTKGQGGNRLHCLHEVSGLDWFFN